MLTLPVSLLFVLAACSESSPTSPSETAARLTFQFQRLSGDRFELTIRERTVGDMVEELTEKLEPKVVNGQQSPDSIVQVWMSDKSCATDTYHQADYNGSATKLGTFFSGRTPCGGLGNIKLEFHVLTFHRKFIRLKLADTQVIPGTLKAGFGMIAGQLQ